VSFAGFHASAGSEDFDDDARRPLAVKIDVSRGRLRLVGYVRVSDLAGVFGGWKAAGARRAAGSAPADSLDADRSAGRAHPFSSSCGSLRLTKNRASRGGLPPSCNAASIRYGRPGRPGTGHRARDHSRLWPPASGV
jgi:hypothetical protein